MESGVTTLYEEFKTNSGGGCYDLVSFHPWGYEHTKIYSPVNTEQQLKELLKQNNLTDDFYLSPTLNEELRPYEYTEPIIQRSTSSEQLMKQLYEIEQLGIIEVKGQSTNEFKVYYYMSFLIYEIKNMAVKIPIKSISSTSEPVWSFEYLIYPNFTVNTEVLNRLRKMTGNENINLNIEGLQPNRLDRGMMRLFSTSLFSDIQFQYIMSCNNAKGITNAIRVMEHNSCVENDYFEIYQKSRMSKKDNIAYTGFKFIGHPLIANEPTFKEYLTMLQLDISTISNLAKNKLQFLDFIEEHKDDTFYEPILLYMQNLDNPFEAMENYEDVERRRSYMRKLKYQVNMALYDSLNYVRDYVVYYEPNLYYTYGDCNPLILENIMWTRGGVQEGLEPTQYTPRKKIRGY